MANDSWIYQGRQYHMWFGSGTKPAGAKLEATSKASLPPLQDRIHSVGHTFAAGLPASERQHAAAQLGVVDHGRLTRVLTGVVSALPLGPRLIAIRVLETNFDAPGIGSFVKAGGTLQAAASHADLREATDLVARSAQEMGLDRFKPFLRNADDHLTQSGGLAALLREMPKPPDSERVTVGQHSAKDRSAANSLVTLVGGGGPTVSPPGGFPGGPWKWSGDPNNSRGGKFFGSNGSTASWDDVDGHWDVDNGQGQRTRYNRFDSPLTSEEAHGPYKGPPRLPLPFRLFKVLPPLFILPEQIRKILEPNSA